MDWQALVVDDWMGLREDRRWAARNCGLSVPRQNGKSVLGELRILAGLHLLKEELIVYTAHQVDTAMEIFERIVARIEENPDLKRRQPTDRNKGIGRGRGSQSITLLPVEHDDPKRRYPRQRFLVKARSKGGVRGFSADIIFLDEAQMGLDEEEMTALGPTQRMRSNPQTILMGTPPLEAGTYWALKARAKGLAKSPRWAWHEWSPPDWFDPHDETHLDDREVWRSTNPAYAAGVMDEEAILQDRDTLGSRFAGDGLGWWPRERHDGWIVIPKDAWEAAHDPHSQLLDPVCFALATDKDRNWTSIAAAGKRGDGLWHVEVIDRRPSVSWAYARVAELLGKWRNCGLAIVASGPAGALIPDIESRTVGDRAGGKPVEVTKASVQDFAKASGMFHTGLTGIAGPDEPDPKRFRWRCASEYRSAVDGAVKDAARHNSGDVWTFARELEGVDTDTSPIEAMALALWGFASFGQTAPNAPVTVSADLRAQAGDFFRPQGRLKL